MTIGTYLLTMWKGEIVGEDAFGNRYYRERGKPRSCLRRRRWVLYKGRPEASKIPPIWHAWLHYTGNATPLENPPETKTWQKPHLPNLTGTRVAYRPPGDLERGAEAGVPAAYEPWNP